MKSILVVLCSIVFSVFTNGQTDNSEHKISAQDQILLQKFWNDFTDAVTKNNKEKIKTLCEFPFYCSPCIRYVKYKNGSPITVKVTRELFQKKHYKVFFEPALKTEVKKHQKFTIQFFHPAFNEQMKRNGVYFHYTLIPPSKQWEGSQGMVYLKKIKGKFKITGIDTIP